MAPNRPAPAPDSNVTALRALASAPVADALHELGVGPDGPSRDEAAARLAHDGPNALRTHHVRAGAVLARQFANPVEVLLLGAAAVSLVVGDRTDAIIVTTIVLLGVVLGFVNELRSERAVEELHERVRHLATVRRGGTDVEIDVTELVRGDLVHLALGQLIPADVRLLEVADLECDEAVLTGENEPVRKQVEPAPPSDSPLDLPSCAFMGTIVRSGEGLGVVAATRGATVFGGIAAQLGERQPPTGFEVGLRAFTKMLVAVTGVLVAVIMVINLVRGQPVLDTVLFALAIAVGLTPQLLPALVTLGLARGAHELMRSQVLVKRLVAIEDLGNIDVLFTDKTGTLTTGTITLQESLTPAGTPDPQVRQLACACSDVTRDGATVAGGNPLDRALWTAPEPPTLDGWRRVGELPFDHDPQLVSVTVERPDGRSLIAKGAPEAVLGRCRDVPAGTDTTLSRLFESGARVIAVATGTAPHDAPTADDEHDLHLAGFVTFLDPPKPDVAASLRQLADLGVDVKVITGDNAVVARHLCGEVGLPVLGMLNGTEIESLDDEGLREALPATTIFARVTPDQKARVIRAQ